MKEILISQYVNRLTKRDIEDFGKQNGVILDINELDIIYQTIKKDWKTIIYGNPTSILNSIKNQFDNNKYQKIEKLYYEFKGKFKDLV